MTMLLSDLEGRLLDLEVHYSNLRNRWVQDEEYYNGTFKLKLPNQITKIMPATGANAVEVPATHIITDEPKITRASEPGKDTSDRRQEDDQDATSFLLAVLQANDQASTIPPLHSTNKFQFLRGMGVLRGPFFSMDKFEDGADDAIFFDSPDPQQVIFAPGPEPREYFCADMLTVAQMEQRADTDKRFKRFDKGSRKPDEKLTLVQWYGFRPNEKECGYAAWEADYSPGQSDLLQNANAADWLIKPDESGYPYLPGDPVLSGYGFDSPLPELLVKSIFNNQVKSLLQGEAEALSIMNGYMKLATFPRYDTNIEADIARANLSFDPATIGFRPDSVKPVDMAPIPSAVVENYNKIVAAIENALFSGVVQGNRPAGVDTASGLAILSGTARLKFGSPLRFLETAVARLLMKVGMLICYEPIAKLIGAKGLSCMGRTIRPTQFHGDYRVRVQLFSEAPEERNSRLNTGIQLLGLENGPSEKYVFEKYLGIDNYEEDLEQKEYEALVKSEAMRNTNQQFLSLIQPPPAEAPTGQNSTEQLTALQNINQMAQQANQMSMAQPQMPGAPGSAQDMAQQANAQAQMGQPVQQPMPVGVG